MPANAALFLFLAATVVSVFAFLSIFTWVTTPSRERLMRDRLTLLKTVAEQPGENARQVLDYLRAEDEGRIERKQREERKGYVIAGLCVIATGVGIGGNSWTVALMLVLIGLVFTGAGLFPVHRPPTR